MGCIVFQKMFLVPLTAGLEGASLRKAYCSYVVEGKRLITQSKNIFWKTIEKGGEEG